MDLSESKRTRRLICLALALATVGVYARVVGFGFVNFDDPDYVTKNPIVKAGFTFKGVMWAFTHSYVGNWHPVTWISHMLDCQIFGLHSGGPHLENVAIHAVNAVLLFLLLHRLTGAQWRSALVAALFALHPLHVESVAWISERKDVLSTFLALLSLLAYVRYVNESGIHPPSSAVAGSGATNNARSKIWFASALALFAMGLMAKSMVVTLPFVMLLLDFWPLQRVENTGWRTFFTPQFGRLVREKWAWFVLAAACSVITVHAQGRAVATLKNLPIRWRIRVAIESYAWYVQKSFWPTHLAMLYPLRLHGPLFPFICACLFVLMVSVAAVLTANRRPFFLTGWFWFLGTLVPVIGLVQVGMQATADRYTYLPSIGLFLIIIWSGYELVHRSRPTLILGSCAMVIVLLLISAATFVQAGYWKNSITLFSHAVRVTRDNDIAYLNLGVALFDGGRYDEALEAYKSALAIEPTAELYMDIGRALAKTAKPEEALVEYERAAHLNPKDPQIQFFWATTLAMLGKKDEALAHDDEAVKLQPDNAFYQNNLGAALAISGRNADALAHYTEAVRLEPQNAQYQNNVATALARSGQVDAAIDHYQMAIRDDPKFAEPYSNLGALRTSQHRLDDAVREYSEAVRLSPTNAVIHLNAGLVFAKMGRLDEAVNQFAEAQQIDPASSEAQYEYGHGLLLQGQFQRARNELTKAVRMKPDNAFAQFFLGVACLESHSVEDGLKHLEEAARSRPNWAEPLNARARVLAASENDKVRNGAEAVRLAEEAARLTSRQQPAILFTLSAAYAEAGRFDDAVATANEAAALAQNSGQTSLVIEIGKALELYKSHKPFRDVSK